jgi:polar amino acid transport system substrate-binding protein
MEHPSLPPLALLCALCVAALNPLASPSRADDSLARVRSAGRLVYGCDAEGGGPYAYSDPADPARHVGFEVELMALLCGPLGPEPTLYQGQWDALLSTLSAGHVDVVVNGYENTPERAADYLATRPYYVFRLQTMAPRGGRIASFDDLTRPKPGGGRWAVAVLGSSAAETYARQHGGPHVEVIYFNGATDCMMAVRNGQADATLQDEPAALFYASEYSDLALVGPPVGRGEYVMYLRPEDVALRDALDAAIGGLITSGELRRLYERYGIWTDAQEELPRLGPRAAPSAAAAATPDRLRGLPLLARYGNTLLVAAGMTVFLSFASMPLAMAVGLAIALGRLYGPGPLRPLLAAYVELIRGTPLMLQLFVLFFLLPRLGLELPALVAGIAGLAINYSAYEAEIYRAGLQAIPSGQMEAALSLGMSRRLALRRVIVPQAVRIVIPPVTNDFIALFKDTSVCSVISIVELTKRYAILANSTGGMLEFAAATALLYLAMSAPLAWVVRSFERRLSLEGAKGVAA